jgi:hypothetical protein
MTLPMFYTAITVLDRELHRQMRSSAGPDKLQFAAKSHLIPCVIEEFGVGGLEMPILFAPTADGATAVFLTGCEPGNSIMVRADGTWAARYSPAYLRRFPFILGDVDDKQSLICVDESQLNGEQGEALFEETGENSAFLNATIDFVNQYAASARTTEAFVKTLVELKLLGPVSIDFSDVNGKAVSLHGLLAVDEAALANLADQAFLELRRKNYLTAIFAHRNSLNNIQTLSMRK